jgi:hypothetical protein
MLKVKKLKVPFEKFKKEEPCTTDIIRDVTTFGQAALPFLLEKVKDEKLVEVAVAVIARIDDGE